MCSSRGPIGRIGGGSHTRVVEFAGLANGETTTANDKDLLDIDSLLRLNDAALEVGLGVGGLLADAVAADGSRGRPSLDLLQAS